MDTGTRERVRLRARGCCEYCRLDQRYSSSIHHIEHIVSRQHGGTDDLTNLALACHRCNLAKGPNLSGIDPKTGSMVALFHPRRQAWAQHFRFRGVRIEGLTPIGRATVAVLAMNDARRLELRAEVQALGEL